MSRGVVFCEEAKMPLINKNTTSELQIVTHDIYIYIYLHQQLEGCIDDKRQFKTASINKRLVTPLF